MMRSSLTSRKHLSPEQLIRHLDGELATVERARVTRHLKACWTCRREANRYSSTIDRFVEFQQSYRDEPAMSPPRQWGGFSSSLKNAAATPKPSCSPISLLLSSRFARSAAAGMAGLAILFYVAPVPVASAQQILERSTASERAALGAVSDPVVIQRLRVQTVDGSAACSLWRAPLSGRSREVAGDDRSPELLADVADVYAKVGLDPASPLSAGNYSNWSRSLRHRTQSVRREGSLLRLQTTTEDSERRTVEAQLVVRTADWHPIEETVQVSDKAKTKLYRVTELSYEVKPLTSELARVFDVPEPSPSVKPLAAARPSVRKPVALSEFVPESVVNQIAAVETEIAALAKVRNIGADIQESAQVRRVGSSVRITAYPETQERKLLVERELGQLPGATLEINVLGALPVPSKRTRPRLLQVSSEPGPLSTPKCLGKLSEQLGSSTVANQLISRQMILLSKVSFEMGALNELTTRFSRETRNQLSGEARRQLDGLVVDHFEAARQAWLLSQASSAPILAAIGVVPAAEIAEGQPLTCADWANSSFVLAQASRRLQHLYEQSFTVLVGEPSSEMGDRELQLTVNTIRNTLGNAFSSGVCRPN